MTGQPLDPTPTPASADRLLPVVAARPRRWTRRRILAAGFAGLIGGAALWSGLWFVAAGLFRSAVDQWVDYAGRQGIVITHGKGEISGFPFTLRYDVPGVDITWTANAGLGYAGLWQGESLSLSAQAISPRTLRARLPEQSFLRLTPPATASGQAEARSYGIAQDLAEITFRYRSGELDLRIEVDGGRALAASGRPVLDSEKLYLRLRFPKLASRDHLTPSLEIEGDLRGLTAPDLLPLLDRPSSLLLRAVVMGAAIGPTAQDALANWRDDGGTVEIRHLRVRSGGVLAQGDGTLALDSQMRALAAGSVEISGHEEAIDRLVARQSVQPRDAALAKILLAALEQTDRETGARHIFVPLTVQDGLVYLGPVRLARVQPIF